MKDCHCRHESVEFVRALNPTQYQARCIKCGARGVATIERGDRMTVKNGKPRRADLRGAALERD